MSLEQASYLAQIAGSIAVVVSLIYIGVQLHQNTAQLKRSESNATLSQSSTFRHMLITDRDAAQVWLAGLRNEPPLDPVDRMRFDALLADYTFIALQVWERTKLGLHPGGMGGWCRGHRAALVRTFATPGGGAWWTAHKTRFPPDLVAQVEVGFREGATGVGHVAPAVDPEPDAAVQTPSGVAEAVTPAKTQRTIRTR